MFFSSTGSPGSSWTRAVQRVVVVAHCGCTRCV